jgi:S-adenosylmethionine hydrolase
VPLVTLLTDFGAADWYVAAVKGTLLRVAGERGAAPVTLVDVTHEVAPGDVAGGAFHLAAAAPAFPPDTVHLAVVDPGVGSDRRILVAEAAGALFVAPDNGLLEHVLGTARVRAVTRSDLFLAAPGATFHGRDRFAPVAAWLLAGGAPEELGPPVDDPVRLHLPRPRREGDELVGRVAHVDRFGNLVTDLPAGWLAAGDAPEASVGGHRTQAFVTCYDELAAGVAGLLVGSLGTLELSLRGASLADRWGVARGAAVRVAPRR